MFSLILYISIKLMKMFKSDVGFLKHAIFVTIKELQKHKLKWEFMPR